MSAHPEPRIVARDDVRLAVYEQGNPAARDPPLVLVHGWPDTHDLWRHVIPHLADRFRIVSYDTRGAGASTSPPPCRPTRCPNWRATCSR